MDEDSRRFSWRIAGLYWSARAKSSSDKNEFEEMPGLPAEEPNPNPLEEFREPDYRLSDGDEDIRQPVNHDHHDPIRGFNDLPDREGYRPNDERRDCQANDGEADDIDGIDFTPTP